MARKRTAAPAVRVLAALLERVWMARYIERLPWEPDNLLRLPPRQGLELIARDLLTEIPGLAELLKARVP